MDTESAIEKPDEKVLLVWRVSNAISYGIFFMLVAIVTVILAVFNLGIVIWAIAGLVLIGLLWALSGVVLRRQWENWTFQITPEALEMSHGWIWKHRRVVALDRIQHVDINSGPFDRKFGLVQVVVYTAGTTVGLIPGLVPERANRLRDQLMAGRSIE
ncbi:MAG: PH domain-containing protein [Chlorobia bacterium]|nr:PH domain-containing protein [Fimbriimonadaceae bacterium]